jgi:hypothetical protein
LLKRQTELFCCKDEIFREDMPPELLHTMFPEIQRAQPVQMEVIVATRQILIGDSKDKHQLTGKRILSQKVLTSRDPNRLNKSMPFNYL